MKLFPRFCLSPIGIIAVKGAVISVSIARAEGR
jgi:hypothetical protein